MDLWIGFVCAGIPRHFKLGTRWAKPCYRSVGAARLH